MLSVVFALAIANPGSGTVEGELMFPACDVPADLQVCAEQGDKLICTDDLRYARGTLTYSLTLPAGTYRVFAQTASMLPGVRAYFTEAVRCGLDVECKDHTPILIDVAHRQVIKSVNPADWTEPQAPELISLAEN